MKKVKKFLTNCFAYAFLGIISICSICIVLMILPFLVPLLFIALVIEVKSFRRFVGIALLSLIIMLIPCIGISKSKKQLSNFRKYTIINILCKSSQRMNVLKRIIEPFAQRTYRNVIYF